ncbi:MAG: pyridoxamine 5'-phosphate oxidase family protein [Actinomycetes bacterium]|jgi:nitroimidazol reductase NimA-like FMN-containing flavoprotein (pyridoxamine 5'-phosphate oxidase superfamily)|nr:pyridoxamine 5'-phosphate oxidase family protein [Actinomycetes bacterium]
MDVPAGFEDLFDDGVRAFLALATTRPSGDPVVVPVWFVSDAQGLVFSTGTDAWKAHDMRARPSVAGMVMAEGEHERYVSVRGTAHEVLDPEAEGIDRQALYRRIVRRYEGHDPSGPHTDVFFRLVPTRITGYDYRGDDV